MTTLELIYTQDNQLTPSDTLDLLCFSGADGFQIANNGWVPAIGTGKTQESLTLHAKGDNQDEVIAFLETVLRKWKNYVLWARDFAQEKSVWLRVQWENETNIRQCRLLSFDFQINSSPFGEFWEDAYFTEATITFERLEWEQGPAYPNSIFIPAGQSVFAGVIALPSSIVVGDINARVLSMILTGTTTFRATTVWVALRRNRHGDPLSFIPVWNCADGDMVGWDGSVEADTTALSGQRVTINFVTRATLALRFLIFLFDAIAPATTFNEQRGKFLVLMRAMVSDSSTVTRARITYGTGGDITNGTTLPRVEIETPLAIVKTWTLYEMGVVSIPNARHSSLVDSDFLREYFISLDAERVSGLGHLYVDSFIFLPVDEAYIKVGGTGQLSSTGDNLRIYQNDLDEALGYMGAKASEVEQRSFGIPPNIIQDNIGLIIAGDDIGNDSIKPGSVLGSINITYIPRWNLARGNE